MKISFLNSRRDMLGSLVAFGLLTALAVPAVAANTEVNVDMWDKSDGTQGMTLSTNAVKAGKVTFIVTNISRSDQEHEFLVARTDLTPDKLPLTQAGARVDESKLPGIEELGDLEPGKTGELTLILKPGKYLLFCIEEGHIKAGMFASLTVTP